MGARSHYYPDGSAFGTPTTVRGALALGLPVLFIDTAAGGSRPIDPGADLNFALEARALDEARLTSDRERLVSRQLTLASR